MHCALELVRTAENFNAQLAAGIHIKEASVNETHFVSGVTRDFVESVLSQAKPREIVITQTVKHLLLGAGLTFIQHNSVYDVGLGESLLLYAVMDHLDQEGLPVKIDRTLLPQNDSVLENVLQSIDVHLESESFGVEMLCREVGISERQLQRKIKAITNKSPNQLITSVRLHRAKELLIAKKGNIAEIAFKTGFGSPSYFSKCFRKEFGLSPSDFIDR